MRFDHLDQIDPAIVTGDMKSKGDAITRMHAFEFARVLSSQGDRHGFHEAGNLLMADDGGRHLRLELLDYTADVVDPDFSRLDWRSLRCGYQLQDEGQRENNSDGRHDDSKLEAPGDHPSITAVTSNTRA